jgi:CubicO group peptidase (beta-lactamase class C family)
LLQLLVEEVTHDRFAHFMQHTVFDPLGMTRTTFDEDEALEHGIATSHVPGSLARGTHYHFAALAAAALYSDLTDIGRFAIAHLPGEEGAPPGRGVLPPETLVEMREPAARMLGGDIWGLVGIEGACPQAPRPRQKSRCYGPKLGRRKLSVEISPDPTSALRPPRAVQREAVARGNRCSCARHSDRAPGASTSPGAPRSDGLRQAFGAAARGLRGGKGFSPVELWSALAAKCLPAAYPMPRVTELN